MIASMQYEHVLVDRHGAVGVVTLDRPKVLNALSPALIAELSDALDRFDADPDVRPAGFGGRRRQRRYVGAAPGGAAPARPDRARGPGRRVQQAADRGRQRLR